MEDYRRIEQQDALKSLRVLLLEDSLLDAELILANLSAGGIDCQSDRVDTSADFLAALEKAGFDLILADYSMPSFDGDSALALARERRPEVPFIFVSGAIGEELAIETLKRGATDYVLKQRLERLVPSVRRALQLAGERSARKRMEKEREELLIRMRVARARAEEAERRAEFLADASRLLDSSLDYDTTLAFLPQIAVPMLADWCVVDMLAEDQSIQRTATAHVDPAKVELVSEMARRYLTDLKSSDGPAKTLSTGQSAIVFEVSESLLQAMARDGQHLETLRQLGMKSYMVTPLLARGRTLGAITFVSGESGRRYWRADLALAEDLARRAALSLDNARLYHEAQEAVRRRDEFLAMLAHELRNPLASIASAACTMRLRGMTEPSLEQARSVVERQTQHTARLLDDLLDISRVTQGRIELRKEPLDLATVVADAEQVSRPFVEDRGHQFVKSLPPEPLFVDGDPTRLEQVLVNLLNNAAKYTEPGGRIWLTAGREADEVVIRVRDTGVGIVAEMLPHVFDLFRQASPSLDRSQGGLGIGLTLVRSLVEMHGGTVTVSSAGLGQGSEFVVRLPSGSAAPTAPEPRVALMRARGRRILIIEDNPDNRDMLRDLLQLCGHDVDVAEDGPRGIQTIQRDHPDVALIDIGLPGLDGYQVAQKVRAAQRGRDIFLVALTGYGQLEDRDRALAAGFDAHLVKPVSLDELSRLLAT